MPSIGQRVFVIVGAMLVVAPAWSFNPQPEPPPQGIVADQAIVLTALVPPEPVLPQIRSIQAVRYCHQNQFYHRTRFGC